MMTLCQNSRARQRYNTAQEVLPTRGDALLIMHVALLHMQCHQATLAKVALLQVFCAQSSWSSAADTNATLLALSLTRCCAS
jgi:hypothetical protein